MLHRGVYGAPAPWGYITRDTLHMDGRTLVHALNAKQ